MGKSRSKVDQLNNYKSSLPQIYLQADGLTAEEKKVRSMDFGIALMIVLDFEPYNFVNR